MFILCNLSVLVLLLTLHGQVHVGAIIGGHEASPHSRPYMALLEITTHDNRIKHCGGFLVSEDFVMTAAHCQERSVESFKVYLGVHRVTGSYDNEVQILSVKEAFPHEGFNATGLKNDIMLLKLASSATFSRHVKPVTLANKNDDFVPKSCVVSGWGKTNMTNTHLSHTLMEVDVILIGNKLCDDEDHCSKGKHGPGPGDTGALLVCEDGRVYGVVSGSKTINQDIGIYKYTNIPENRDWIDRIMNHDG